MIVTKYGDFLNGGIFWKPLVACFRRTYVFSVETFKKKGLFIKKETLVQVFSRECFEMFKGEHKKFKKKLLTYFLCNKILSENFLFYNKTWFPKNSWVLFLF